MTTTAGPISARLLGPSDEAAAVLSRVFSGQKLADGSDRIEVELPNIVTEGSAITLGVEATWRALVHAPTARLYVIADENRVPLLAQIDLWPEAASPRVTFDVRLDASTHVRVVLALEDGTLLQAARWVWVLPRNLIPIL